jgi:DNA-binding NtrC family response regulator
LSSSVLYLGCPPPDRAHCERQLDAAHLSVVWVDSIASALAELRSERMPLLIDLAHGSQVVHHIQEVRSKFPRARVFAVADPKHPALTTGAVLAGATDVFARPLSIRSAAIVAGLVPNREPRSGALLPEGCVRSGAMRTVMAITALSSSMRAGVLIRGEEGSGRQFLAHAVHVAHHGNAAPFVAVDCARHSADALERLLFAHAAGANGRECVGAGSLLHQATGGTLYLRQFTGLPLRLQLRLARVLRGEAWLEGNGHRASLDVRPITGVGPAFDRNADDGRVRDDLIRVLSVIDIDMPPLRQRREDIAAIARDLLRDICAIKQLPPRTLSPSAMALLAALPWHGNVVELRKLLENVLTAPAASESTIALDDVVSRLHLNGNSAVQRGATLKAARAQFEREYIAAALEESHGRISAAAEVLGLRRTNLYRKIRSLRISPPTPIRS